MKLRREATYPSTDYQFKKGQTDLKRSKFQVEMQTHTLSSKANGTMDARK